MVPVALGAELVDEQILKSVAHVDNAVSHLFDLTKPTVHISWIRLVVRHAQLHTMIDKACCRQESRRQFWHRALEGWSTWGGLLEAQISFAWVKS